MTIKQYKFVFDLSTMLQQAENRMADMEERRSDDGQSKTEQNEKDHNRLGCTAGVKSRRTCRNADL